MLLVLKVRSDREQMLVYGQSGRVYQMGLPDAHSFGFLPKLMCFKRSMQSQMTPEGPRVPQALQTNFAS